MEKSSSMSDGHIIISEEQVAHVARLARLGLDADEQRRLTDQLNTILTYMEQLSEVPTEDVEPTAHVFDLVNVYRGDETGRRAGGTSLASQEAALSNAPETEQHFFVVPRIVE